jgi:hypothetical protein
MNGIEGLLKDGEEDGGKYLEKLGEPFIVSPTLQRHW